MGAEMFTAEAIVSSGSVSPDLAMVLFPGQGSEGPRVSLYNHAGITRWQAEHGFDPMTRETLRSKDIIPINPTVLTSCAGCLPSSASTSGAGTTNLQACMSLLSSAIALLVKVIRSNCRPEVICAICESERYESARPR